MKFEEIYIDEEPIEEWMGQKAFDDYWALQADPRYRADLEQFKFEQASGSGEWDY